MKTFNSITRAIIEATVDRGLREIDEDPQRSIRKLIDMGKQFSNGRFVGDIYSIFQDLLRNEDSPYYHAIEHLLHHTNRNALKHFGINLGYNSFTIGGKQIRNEINKHPYTTPWSVSMTVDPARFNSLSVSEMDYVIKQGLEMGIYNYYLTIANDITYIRSLAPMFKKHKECSFMLNLPDEELSVENADILRPCTNVLTFLNASGDFIDANAIILRRQRSWYGCYAEYDESTADEVFSPEFLRKCIGAESSFVITRAKGCVALPMIKESGEKVKEIRVNPMYPLFVFDTYGDALNISKLLTGQEVFFEIREDRSVFTNNGIFAFEEKILDLKKLFSLTLC